MFGAATSAGAGGDLPPVVLIASSEALLRVEAADRLRAQARAAGYTEREIFEVDARFDWSQVQASCAAMSLFASRRIVELRIASGKPNKDGVEWLQDYCRNPAPDVLLLILCEDWSKKHEGAWFTAVQKAGRAQVLWPIKVHEMSGWLGQRLRAQGLEASREALELLVDRVEGNLLAAAQEVDKLALLRPEGRIDVDFMANAVADNARYDVFGLSDAAIGGDAQRALQMLAGLRAEGEAVPALVSWLSGQVQQLLRVAEAKSRGANVESALQAAGVWSSRQGPFKKALARGDVAHFEALLAQCAKIERIGKGREQGDGWRELERLLVALAEPRVRPALLAG
ncbi:MAG: DNA polymerase III subunit delta [Xanthomonadales bacterium]|nr:DNA polymerase III subunit delta [Xanthomonadales bacterium]